MADTQLATATSRRPVEGDNRLPELAERIKTGHKQIRDALNVKGLVPKAIMIGDWLNEAKPKVGHGEWQKWLKDNCGLSIRSATRYMSLASNKAPLEEKKKAGTTLADMTLTDADKIVSKAKKAALQGNGNAAPTPAAGDLPASTQTNDDVTKLEDKLFVALKAWRKADEQAATDTVFKFIQRLRDADLYIEN